MLIIKADITCISIFFIYLKEIRGCSSNMWSVKGEGGVLKMIIFYHNMDRGGGVGEGWTPRVGLSDDQVTGKLSLEYSMYEMAPTKNEEYNKQDEMH